MSWLRCVDDAESLKQRQADLVLVDGGMKYPIAPSSTRLLPVVIAAG
jgi:hypothetical protein